MQVYAISKPDRFQDRAADGDVSQSPNKCYIGQVWLVLPSINTH